MRSGFENRSLRLAVGEAVRLRDAEGCSLRCCAGTVCITQEGDSRGITLEEGERLVVIRPGLVTVRALRGVQDVWTGGGGVAVVHLAVRPLL